MHPDGKPEFSHGYRRWLIFVLLLVSIFNFADRAILAVLAQPIKEDLKLTDTDLGLLQGIGFAIFYAFLGIPLGMLADRMNRKGLIAICVALWSAMTVACGFAANFLTLLLGRVGVGIGEAGVQPALSSLLADHFRSNKRSSIMAIVTLGSPIGFLLGQAVGGWVASVWNWRAAFAVLGIPGLCVAAFVLLTLREPPRGLADGVVPEGPPPSLMNAVRYLLSKPTYLHVLAGMTIAGFTFNAVATFVLPFYLRGFDVPLGVLGALFGMVSFTSNALGMLVGGFGVDRLARHDPRWSIWTPAAAFCLCIPFYFGAFASSQLALSLACIWFGNFTLITYFAPTSGTMQNLVGPRMRATATSITFLFGNLLGAGLGPTIVGILSDLFAKRAFAFGDFIASCPGGRAIEGAPAALDRACRDASMEGLRYALMSVLAIFLWAAVHYLIAARTVRRDLYSAEEVPAGSI